MNNKQSNIEQIYPLTPMQEGMLFHAQNDDSQAYFTQSFYARNSVLDLAVIEQSLAMLFQRHDILRTSFVYEKLDKPVQVVLRNRKPVINVRDISNLSEKEADLFIETYKINDRKQGFNLTKDTLLRLSILQKNNNESIFLWSYHHTLMDGWCLGVLIAELKEIYDAILENRLVNLPAPQPFSRYIKWLEGQDKKASMAYWKQYLEGYESVAMIPTITNHDVNEAKHQVFTLNLGKEKSQQIEVFAKQEKVTLNTIFQAIWGILLAKYNSTNDVVYGNVVSGRPSDLQGIDQMLGLFINTIPLRLRFDAHTTLPELLQAVHQDSIEGLPHHFCSLAEIQQQTELKGELIKHIVAFENYPFEKQKTNPANPFDVNDAEAVENTNYDFDIDINLDEEIKFNIFYNSQSYPTDYIHLIAESIEGLFIKILENKSIKVSDLEIVTDNQSKKLLFEFNDTFLDLSNDLPINVRFEQQVEAYPEAIAIVHNCEEWTYSTLNKEANRIANTLIKQGVKHGDFVGVHLERNPMVVAAILAIMKAGGVYVPLDTQNPATRTQELIESSEVKGLITDESHLELLGSDFAKTLKGIICIDDVENIYISENQEFSYRNRYNLEQAKTENPINHNLMDSWAYMLYTSGSTGKPKGAITRHDGAMNHILAEFNALSLPDGFTFLQSASIASDISVWQILAPILKAGTIVIIDKNDVLDFAKTIEVIEKQQVTIAEFVPSYLVGLVDYLENFAKYKTELPHLEWMMMVGEDVPPALVNQWFEMYPSCRILNGYGPCEASDDITQFLMNESLLSSYKKVPIGKPIANMNIFVLDADNQLVPVGVPGELCVSGVGVGAGYWKDEQKTADKFIHNPFEKTLGSTIYKTGDLARWLPDGNLEFLGRIDRQIKLRGFRIELGEIEAFIRTLDGVRDIHVVPFRNENREQSLLAFLTLDDSDVENKPFINALRMACAEQLPSYMIPSYFQVVEEMPYNLSDKIDDKKLLILYQSGGHQTDKVIVECENETEEKLLNIWKKLLEIEQISVLDNFFEIGGHSLKATRLISNINKVFDTNLSIRTVFSYPTIRSLSEQIQNGSLQFKAIAKAASQANYPLSHAQSRLWLLNQFEANTNYNMSDAFLIKGEIEIDAFQSAFEQLIERHEVLRTIFISENGEPKQVILPNSTLFNINFQDLSQEQNALQIAHNQLFEDSKTVFDLGKAPLFKARLLKISSSEFMLIFVAHHIITDGWSSEVLVRDILQNYSTLKSTGKLANIPPLPIQYKDYALWHNQQLTTQEGQKHQQYWQSLFNDEIPVLNFPTDFARQSQLDSAGATIETSLNESLTKSLKDICQNHQVSMFMVLMTALKTLIYRYTGQTDIIVGTPVAGREHSDLEDQIGFYVNTLALRTRFEDTDTFRELLLKVKTNTIQGFEHQMYPFDKVIEDLNVARDMNRNPLFDIMLAFQNTNDEKEMFRICPELTFEEVSVSQDSSKFDLTLEVYERNNQLHLAFEYNTNLFKSERIKRLTGHFENIIKSIVSDLTIPIAQIEYLNQGEVLAWKKLNDTKRDYPKDRTVADLFDARAMVNPDKIAVIFEGKSITYRQLRVRSNQLANYLLTQGVEPESFVGVCMSRSVEMIIAILGVLKAGAAYVPIDVSYPQERIAHILNDSGLKFIITDGSGFALDNEEVSVLSLKTIAELLKVQSVSSPVNELDANSLAYLMYTSGSTGRPKGSMISHQNIVSLVKSTNYVNLNADDVLLSTGSPSFDAVTFEYWGLLLNGGTLVLCNQDELLNNDSLKNLIRSHQTTKMWMTVGWFNQIIELDIEVFEGIKWVIFGGDRISPKHINIIKNRYPDLAVVHAYGPTENTTFSTTHLIRETNLIDIPIGKPLSNRTTYIVDKFGKLCPYGVIGELWVGGDGLGRGYYNQPELNAEKFINNPFEIGKKIYKTGDLVLLNDDNTISFVGRADNQVKIRGFRVELGEIEVVLQNCPNVVQGVVGVQIDTNSNKKVVAYVVAEDGFDKAKTLSELKEKLPEYMIPSAIMVLEQMPLNANGKIDRKNLPFIEEATLINDFVEPTTKTERHLVNIWQKFLTVQTIGIEDNFFELGGHSLLATRIIHTIQVEMNKKIGLSIFFKNPTIKALGAVLEQIKDEKIIAIPLVTQAEYYDLSRSQSRLWLMNQMGGSQSAYNIAVSLEIVGNLDIKALEKAFLNTIERHEILRTVFVEIDGLPYQKISTMEECNFGLPVFEVSQEADIEEFARNILQEEEQFVFELDQMPLIRFNLLTNGNRHFLSLNIHHIIGDGWSMQMLSQEVMASYYQIKGINHETFEPLRIQYKDFAAWQNTQLVNGDLESEETFWMSQFDKLSESAELPIDNPRSKVRQYESNAVSLEIQQNHVALMDKLIIEKGLSKFMILQGFIKILLRKYVSDNNIVIGTPVAGRSHPELANQLGCYVNLLALKSEVKLEDSFEEVLVKIQTSTLRSFENQQYPFDLLIEKLNRVRNLSRNPLFDVTIAYNESINKEETNQAELIFKELPQTQTEGFNKYDLSFEFEQLEDKMNVKIIYNTSLFFDEKIEQMKEDFTGLIQQLLENPDKPISTFVVNQTPQLMYSLEDDFS
jgi:amino acid adenylation domain-containing protein